MSWIARQDASSVQTLPETTEEEARQAKQAVQQRQLELDRKIGKSGSADEVLELVTSFSHEFDLGHSTRCLAALVDHRETFTKELADSEAFTSLITLQGKLLREDNYDDFTAQIGYTAINVAQLREIAPSIDNLIPIMTETALKHTRSMSAGTLTELVKFHAIIHRRDEDFLAATASAAIPKMRFFSPRYLSNITWAYGTLGYSNGPLMKALASTTVRKMRLFDGQYLATVLASFAKLRNRNMPLLNAFSRFARNDIGRYGPTELSIFVWSYATLQHKDQELLDAVAKSAGWQLGLFSPRDLSMLARCGAMPHLQIQILSSWKKWQTLQSRKLILFRLPGWPKQSGHMRSCRSQTQRCLKL